ncbi:MAG: hypothetical protein AAF998_01705 [Bacteroidota bacterium]
MTKKHTPTQPKQAVSPQDLASVCHLISDEIEGRKLGLAYCYRYELVWALKELMNQRRDHLPALKKLEFLIEQLRPVGYIESSEKIQLMQKSKYRRRLNLEHVDEELQNLLEIQENSITEIEENFKAIKFRRNRNDQVTQILHDFKRYQEIHKMESKVIDSKARRHVWFAGIILVFFITLLSSGIGDMPDFSHWNLLLVLLFALGTVTFSLYMGFGIDTVALLKYSHSKRRERLEYLYGLRTNIDEVIERGHKILKPQRNHRSSGPMEWIDIATLSYLMVRLDQLGTRQLWGRSLKKHGLIFGSDYFRRLTANDSSNYRYLISFTYSLSAMEAIDDLSNYCKVDFPLDLKDIIHQLDRLTDQTGLIDVELAPHGNLSHSIASLRQNANALLILHLAIRRGLSSIEHLKAVNLIRNSIKEVHKKDPIEAWDNFANEQDKIILSIAMMVRAFDIYASSGQNDNDQPLIYRYLLENCREWADHGLEILRTSNTQNEWRFSGDLALACTHSNLQLLNILLQTPSFVVQSQNLSLAYEFVHNLGKRYVEKGEGIPLGTSYDRMLYSRPDMGTTILFLLAATRLCEAYEIQDRKENFEAQLIDLRSHVQSTKDWIVNHFSEFDISLKWMDINAYAAILSLSSSLALPKENLRDRIATINRRITPLIGDRFLKPREWIDQFEGIFSSKEAMGLAYKLIERDLNANNEAFKQLNHEIDAYRADFNLNTNEISK